MSLSLHTTALMGGGGVTAFRSAFPKKHFQPERGGVGVKSMLREFHLQPFYIVDQSVRPGSC